MSSKEPTSQVLLFSQPRTGCHLLERMLSKQSCIHTYVHHPFGISGRYPRQWLQAKLVTKIPEDLKQKQDTVMQKGLRVWKDNLATANSEGKAIYAHFHPLFAVKPEEVYLYLTQGPAVEPGSPRNPLSVPDELLLRKGTVPLLTVRNPRLQVPSLYRVSRDTLPGGVTYSDTLASVTGRWTRLLYDWYLAKGIEPLVVDADDYMSSADFVRYLCEVSGLNPNEALVKWDSSNQTRNMSKIERNHAAIQQTLFASQGPEARRAAKNVDLDAEERGWEVEFGSEGAQLVKDVVKAVMPEYEYLRQRRLKMPASRL